MNVSAYRLQTLSVQRVNCVGDQHCFFVHILCLEAVKEWKNYLKKHMQSYGNSTKTIIKNIKDTYQSSFSHNIDRIF